MLNNIFEICSGIIKTGVKNLLNFVCNNYILLSNLMLILLPSIFVYYYTKSLDLSTTIPLIQIAILFVRKFFEIVKNEKDGFPVLNKRLTVKRNNEITIKQGCLQEAIVYLSQVEDYTERCGYIKKIISRSLK